MRATFWARSTQRPSQIRLTYRASTVCRKTGRVAATVRVMPDHPSLPHPFVPGLFLQG